MTRPPLRLSRIELVSTAPDRLARFYEAALGFARVGEASVTGGAAARLMGQAVAAARVVSLRLGDERVDLLGCEPDGAPYPGEVPGWSPLFQHCALVVSDMAAACARLASHAGAGWRPISRAGPERLPESSGGVTAFKFRDPEGHPLELLAFPDGKAPERWRRAGARGPCLGIDHSAISVADTDASLRFYAGLGLAVSARSHNLGPEQARLDAVPGADVAVTGLSFPEAPGRAGRAGTPFAGPHVELLCYRGAWDRPAAPAAPCDVAATRLVFEAGGAGTPETLRSEHPAADREAALLRDPDGHLIRLTAGG